MSSFTVHKVIFRTLAISDSGRLGVRVRKNVVGGIIGLSINKDFDEKKSKFENVRVKNGSALAQSKKMWYAQKKTLSFIPFFGTRASSKSMVTTNLRCKLRFM